MIIKTVILFVLLCVSTFAKDLEVEPLRDDEIGGTLGDIDCRMWAAPGMRFKGRPYIWSDYRDDDKVTWAHEGTHSINSRIRWQANKNNGYYLLDGYGIYMDNPKLTLKQIARNIPKNKRGSIYNTYLVQQAKYWNDTPLYVLDELVAYTNAAVVGVELDLQRRAKESYSHAVEMYYYCDVAYQLCKKDKYKDLDKFKEVLDIVQQRLEVLEKILNDRVP